MSTLALIPIHDRPRYASLPIPVREEFRQWAACITAIECAHVIKNSK